jgi:hypothetical protein
VWQKNLLERKRTLTSIGSRLGVSAERAFREGLKKILGKYFNEDVREIYIEDKEGVAKGRPNMQEKKLGRKREFWVMLKILTSPRGFKP